MTGGGGASKCDAFEGFNLKVPCDILLQKGWPLTELTRTIYEEMRRRGSAVKKEAWKKGSGGPQLLEEIAVAALVKEINDKEHGLSENLASVKKLLGEAASNNVEQYLKTTNFQQVLEEVWARRTARPRGGGQTGIRSARYGVKNLAEKDDDEEDIPGQKVNIYEGGYVEGKRGDAIEEARRLAVAHGRNRPLVRPPQGITPYSTGVASIRAVLGHTSCDNWPRATLTVNDIPSLKELQKLQWKIDGTWETMFLTKDSIGDLIRQLGLGTSVSLPSGEVLKLICEVLKKKKQGNKRFTINGALGTQTANKTFEFHFNEPVWQVFGEKLKFTRRYACKKHPLVLYPDDKCGGKCGYWDSCELVSYPRREDGTFYPTILDDSEWNNWSRASISERASSQHIIGKFDNTVASKNVKKWASGCSLLILPTSGNVFIKPVESSKGGKIYSANFECSDGSRGTKYVRLLNNWVEVKSVGKSIIREIKIS